MKTTMNITTLLRPAGLSLALLFMCPALSRADKEAEKTETAPAEKGDDTEAGAKKLLSAFLKPDADLKTLSAALRPEKADYEAVFSREFSAKLFALYDPAWASGKLVLTAKEGQTELIVRSAPSADIKAWTKNASDVLPGGYQKIKDEFKEGNTIYSFKFVKPGETLGMAYDGLVFVNGHWRIFPKPFRAAN